MQVPLGVPEPRLSVHAMLGGSSVDVIDFGDAVPDDGADAEFSIARGLFGPASGADPESAGGQSGRSCRRFSASTLLAGAQQLLGEGGDQAFLAFELIMTAAVIAATEPVDTS